MINKFQTYMLNFLPIRLQKYIEEKRVPENVINKLKAYEDVIIKMPSTYETESVSDPICYLHYHIGNFHFYIIEKDKGSVDDFKSGIIPGEQIQAFGYTTNSYPVGELGYINIQELLSFDELIFDINWDPKPLSEVKKITV